MEIEGQAAIVSGGASGLGRATAKALAEAGGRVTSLDVNPTAENIARLIYDYAVSAGFPVVEC